MSFFFNRKGGSIPQNATFRITQQGTEKLQEYSGSPESRVLITLESAGTLSLAELSQRTSMSRGQIERLIPKLISGGYVQLSSTHGVEQ